MNSALELCVPHINLKLLKTRSVCRFLKTGIAPRWYHQYAYKNRIILFEYTNDAI